MRSWWPIAIVALLAGSAGANIAFLVIAAHDASFAVERDYYAKALAWDEVIAQEARNRELGWAVSAAVERGPAARGARLVARVIDRAGAPVRGAAVSVDAFPSARASHVVTGALAPAGAGVYTLDLPGARAGVWEVRLRVARGADVFTGTVAAELR
jgi:nitrogen fixation protein FixH